MDRRTFLKSVSALAVLAATESGVAADVNTLSTFTPNMPPEPSLTGAGEEIIKLNPPDLNGGISLMQALKKRKSTRAFTDKNLTLQELSDLLWSADGVNRPDGKRTSPAAMAKYCVDIYAVLPQGVYLYEVARHELKLVAKGDYRKLAGTQDFVYSAPLNLVYVLNMKSWEGASTKVPEERRRLWAQFEVGFLVQNVYLYCASEGLGAVVRAGLDQKKLGELINVPAEQLVLAQTVGYPK
jgi:nitroreductase